MQQKTIRRISYAY